jgi:hypothetical protein
MGDLIKGLLIFLLLAFAGSLTILTPGIPDELLILGGVAVINMF